MRLAPDMEIKGAAPLMEISGVAPCTEIRGGSAPTPLMDRSSLSGGNICEIADLHSIRARLQLYYHPL